MKTLVLRGMAQRRLRTLLSALAVFLGVAMIAGTYVQTDQIRTAFTEIQQSANAGTDIVVRPQEAFDRSFEASEPIDQAIAERVAAVPGVREVEVELWDSARLVVDGETVGSDVAPSAITSISREPFAPTRIVEGRNPSRPGEIVLDQPSAGRYGVEVGDELGLTVRTGLQPVRLVGTYEYGDGVSLGGSTIVGATLEETQRWADREDQVSSIMALTEAGVTPEELSQRVSAVLPPNLMARTAEADAEAEAAKISDAIGSFLTPALLALAGAAVLVGAFIIFNTFSITVAQRTREFALLRSLGTTRRQLVGVVTGEAALLGVAASALGLVAGLGFAKLLGALFDAAGIGIPRSGMELAPRTIAVSLGVGVGVTLAAAIAPALRATKVPPVLAMQEGAASPRRPRRWVAWVSSAVAVLGLGLLLGGLFAEGSAESRMGTMGGGVVLLFVGVALSARYLVRPIAAVVGWPIERVSRTMGHLARENAVREPGRTATTAAALMVGIGLVAFVAVFADGLKASMHGGFEQRIHGDYVIRGSSMSAADPQTASAADRAQALPGVASVSQQRFEQVMVNRDPVSSTTDIVNGVSVATLGNWYAFDWKAGGDDALDALVGQPVAVVEEQFAKAHAITVGEEFTATSPAGRRVRLTAAGVYRDPLILQGMIVDDAMFDRIAPGTDPWVAWVSADRAADPAALRSELHALTTSFPGLKVQNEAEYQDDLTGALDQTVYLLYALLAMSVVISMFGIANSLFLSIHERTREFGLLRAVGTTRDQVRRLVRYESVITAVIGGLLGIGLGVLFGFLMTTALADLGLTFSVPVVQLVAFLALAVAVGIAGAVLPARRGSRGEILHALQHE
jgi:putative ABC transport system permease protein